MRNCCVIGPVKSGTTLMISLLDAHPQLSLFPLEVKFFTHWFESLSSSQIQFNDLSTFFLDKSKIRLMDHQLSDEKDLMNSGRIDFSGFDFARFREFVESRLDDHQLDAQVGDNRFVTFYREIHAALNEIVFKPRAKWIVSKEGNHGAKHIEHIREVFPKTKFIVLCRDPRDIFASFKAISRRKVEGLHSPTFGVYVSPSSYVYDNKQKNIAAYEDVYSKYREDEDFLFVKYERLVRDVEEEMRRVVDFLEIDFENVLVRPTNLGNLWGGNASELMTFSKVRSERVGKWQSVLKRSEIQVLERFLGRYLLQCNYPRHQKRQRKTWQVVLSVLATEANALRGYMKSANILAIGKRILKTIALSSKSVVFAVWAPDELGR